MFRTLSRLLLPNPLDALCKRARKKQHRKILLGWNRGVGDIALGLYAIVHRIKTFLPEAEITFLIRSNLQEGFSLFPEVKTIIAPRWKRGEPYDMEQTLLELGRDPREFDLIIAWPNPTDWVRWQRGKLIPRLTWKVENDELWKRFDLPKKDYIGVQPLAETNYGLWRNWPEQRWRELFERLGPNKQVVLFGMEAKPVFNTPNVVDLRGKTTLMELLSIIKHRCSALIVPDSGILTLAYYLDASFPLMLVSLWGDPQHGVLKQNVASPNPQLRHRPLVGALRDLSTVSAEEVLCALQ